MDEPKKEALSKEQLNDVCGGFDFNNISLPLDTAELPNMNSGMSPAQAISNAESWLAASMAQGMLNASENQSGYSEEYFKRLLDSKP